MKAIRVQEVGDPDVLQCVDLPTPEPGAGEARVKIEVAGVNFIDTYHRRGWYPMPLPFTPGVEGAGIVDAVGEGVTEVAVGDAVAYGMSTGSYAEYAIVPSRVLVHRVGYIGALGSKRTHAKRATALREAGVSDEQISRIHAPIGLDLGGRSPEEIALAIIAEIVQVRNRSKEARK